MALRDQPYFPLYVQDYLTDEKLNMCSWATQGIYIKILCLLHKQNPYGTILFHQNNKQNLNKIDFFVYYLSKQLPIQKEELHKYLTELITEEVLIMDDEKLYQKRMVRDGEISGERSRAGSLGGGSSLNKQYGKSGILYFLSDKDKKHKIGVTRNLKQRVYQIRSKNRLSKMFDVIKYFKVDDMGKTEDSIKQFFEGNIEGEWINLPFEDALKKFNLFHQNLKQKLKQNTEYEIEYENEYIFNVFKEWLNYKKLRKEKYKTKQSAQLAYDKLVKFSGNNPKEAKEIIETAMSNNWAGFFANRNKNGKTDFLTEQPVFDENFGKENF